MDVPGPATVRPMEVLETRLGEVARELRYSESACCRRLLDRTHCGRLLGLSGALVGTW